jgi:hypothetical protein
MNAVALLEPGALALAVPEVIELIWAEVESGRAPSVAGAVTNLWPFELDEEAATEVVRAGLIFLANDAQHTARRSGSPPIAFGSPHGKRWKPYMQTLAAPYIGADGQTRSFLDFTADDLAAFEDTCASQVSGWSRRGKMAKRTRTLMLAQGAAKVRDLPADLLEEIASDWGES